MVLTLLFAALLGAPAVVPPVEAERRLMLTGFERVRVDGPFTVRVATGSSVAARVVGEPRNLDSVQVRVEGRTLIVSPARNDRGRPVTSARPEQPLVVELSSDRLVGVAVRGSGRVDVERMVGPRIDIAVTGEGTIEVASIDADQLSAMVIGAGSLKLAGRSGQARFLVNGPGTVAADGLSIDTLLVRSEGPGGGRYRARYTADVTAQGSGTVTVEGTARCRTSGTATIRCG